ncbi:FadR/GntR family transcriptional regulator [Streptomyces colonosanans]|uniref:GntR family transcriptional regulator n=1 Tax=Streptomyces colonosanans TaxID=1428652 RepID=A0A1S2PA49_9ACTN|nr:FCD domain-containing protein [Streptomyces colonosanans]OIJ90432.1 GntR family transcriptional regulator [Streptomyces colonosanans]
MTRREPSPPAPQQEGAADAYRPGYEIAAELILEYIAQQRLEPGARLPTEKDLADAVRMSKTVVREAVKILSALGRLSVQKGRGIYVAEPAGDLWRQSVSHFLPANLQQVDEMFEFRRFVETTTARMAAQRAVPSQVKALREAAQQSADAAERNDVRAFNQADELFHGKVGTAAANTFLSATLESVQRLQRQVSAIGLAGNSSGSLVVAAEQHLAIADAVAGGEEDRAAALMAEHIDLTQEQFQREIRHRLFPADDAPVDNRPPDAVDDHAHH